MGMEIPVHEEEQEIFKEDLPRILLVGPFNVGKRSVLHRLLAMGKVRGLPISTSGVVSHGWMIETKYYTVNLCISTASLSDDEARENAKAYASSNQCQAVVLVFDLSNFSTFDVVREWAETLDIQRQEILICVGNKADRVPDHFAHKEYRKMLQKRGESSSDPHPEFWDFGIQQTEGGRLLEDADRSTDQLTRFCMDWCSEHGFEYLEACALDHTFDQCISSDGDLQGVNRIFGALSAHMWPGLTLKSEKGISDNSGITEHEERDTDEESDISFDYERLSNGSAEPWGGDVGPWTIYGIPSPSSHEPESSSLSSHEPEVSMGTMPTSQEPSQGRMALYEHKGETSSHTEAISPVDLINSITDGTAAVTNDVNVEQHNPLPSDITTSNGVSGSLDAFPIGEDSEQVHENGRSQEDVKDFEQLMIEMAHMRENSRLMSDSQRREMAANLALRMASLFDEE